jgi:hypothetical protein
MRAEGTYRVELEQLDDDLALTGILLVGFIRIAELPHRSEHCRGDGRREILEGRLVD